MPLKFKYDDLRSVSKQRREFLDEVVKYEGDDCILWIFDTNILTRLYVRGQPGNGIGIPGRILCEEAHGPQPINAPWIMADCEMGIDGCINPNHVNWRTVEERKAILKKRRSQRAGYGYE